MFLCRFSLTFAQNVIVVIAQFLKANFFILTSVNGSEDVIALFLIEILHQSCQSTKELKFVEITRLVCVKALERFLNPFSQVGDLRMNLLVDRILKIEGFLTSIDWAF